MGVTFQVNPGEHVGLVGRNGAGKTTLFRLAERTEEPDRGQVLLPRGVKLGVVSQQPAFAEGDTARSLRSEALLVFAEMHDLERDIARLEHEMADAAGVELDQIMHSYSDLRHRYETEGGFTYQSRTESVLYGLGFKAEDLTRPSSQLSGGQKARLALAKLLLGQPDLMLLDEPTNHLDVAAVEWLEGFLASYKSAFVIISHDRFLLDRVATKIVEIDKGQATVYSGNYTAYVTQREERRLVQAKEYQQQQQMIARTEEFIRRNIAGQRTKQAKSRRKMLERTERIEAVNEDRAIDFRAGAASKGRLPGFGVNVLRVRDLAVGYGKHVVAGGIDFVLGRGERLGIIGPNGSGKTTFLKTLTQALEPLEGEIDWGAHVKIGYYDQELMNLDKGSTVMAELAAAHPKTPGGGVSETVLRNFLARFLFTGDDVFKPVSALSGGEQSRLALARLVCSGANFLVLDEPTNHLDIPSREALERALADYPGTIVAVSHDRYFLDRIASEILYFEKGTARYFLGGYSDSYDFIHDRQATEVAEAAAVEAAPPSKTKPIGTNGSTKPRTTRKKGGKAPATDELESRIGKLEDELSSLSQRLSSPGSESRRDQIAEMGLRHEAISSELKRLYKEWEDSHTT